MDTLRFSSKYAEIENTPYGHLQDFAIFASWCFDRFLFCVANCYACPSLSLPVAMFIDWGFCYKFDQVSHFPIVGFVSN